MLRLDSSDSKALSAIEPDAKANEYPFVVDPHLARNSSDGDMASPPCRTKISDAHCTHDTASICVKPSINGCINNLHLTIEHPHSGRISGTYSFCLGSNTYSANGFYIGQCSHILLEDPKLSLERNLAGSGQHETWAPQPLDLPSFDYLPTIEQRDIYDTMEVSDSLDEEPIKLQLYW